MTMCDQDFIKAFEPKARLHYLALGAFTAVDQEAVFIVQHDMGGESAVYGGRGSGSTEKNDLEQWLPFNGYSGSQVNPPPILNRGNV